MSGCGRTGICCRGTVKEQLWAPGVRLGSAMARRSARDCDVVVADYDELADFGLEDLAGKTLVTSAVSDERLAELGSRGVDMVLDATPQPFENVTVNAATLEAMMLACVPHARSLTDDDLLDMIVSAGLEPRKCSTPTASGARAASRSSSTRCRRVLRQGRAPGHHLAVLPGRGDGHRRALAYAPPFVYNHVTDIGRRPGPKPKAGSSPSAAHKGTDGAQPGSPTPGCSPRRTALQARRADHGARAFTKVVGDAG